ncbi:putative disease resistance protein (TIR-NBS-LRR class), partial [Trifolium medium]|nr:putative disease resistance protein (TIR-NBS-LRR class) [Trifolium medium]
LNEQYWWSIEGIKGCGVLPVYAVACVLALDGSSIISKEIGKLKSSAQDFDEFDLLLENDIDELQPRATGGEVRSSNNENEDDQEQPSYSCKEEEHPCCSIGMKLSPTF